MPKVFVPKLTERTEGIVSLVPKCSSVADIGCDHGYVSIALVQRGISDRAVACDIKEGPLEHAKRNIEKACLSDRIRTELAPGLEAVNCEDAEVIVIAGMGQRTIADILSNSADIAKKAKYLVLQPQSEVSEMREYLVTNGYNILKNKLMIEKDKYYFAILASATVSECGEEKSRVVKGLRERKSEPEFEMYSKFMDELFGLDLIYEDKNFAYYLSHVIREWGDALTNLSEAKKPDLDRINELKTKKVCAEVALELNTLFCGIDDKLKNMMDGEFIRKLNEE